MCVRQRMGLLEGRGSSRVVEAAIHVAPAVLLTELYTRFLRTHLPQLAAHPISNFVVQVRLCCKFLTIHPRTYAQPTRSRLRTPRSITSLNGSAHIPIITSSAPPAALLESG
jgi:hypothetical protein